MLFLSFISIKKDQQPEMNANNHTDMLSIVIYDFEPPSVSQLPYQLKQLDAAGHSVTTDGRSQMMEYEWS